MQIIHYYPLVLGWNLIKISFLDRLYAIHSHVYESMLANPVSPYYFIPSFNHFSNHACSLIFSQLTRFRFDWEIWLALQYAVNQLGAVSICFIICISGCNSYYECTLREIEWNKIIERGISVLTWLCNMIPTSSIKTSTMIKAMHPEGAPWTTNS